MSKNGMQWNTILTIGAVAVGGYLLYTVILKPLLKIEVPIAEAVTTALQTPTEMAAVVSGALGDKGLIETPQQAEEVAKTLTVTLPEITPTNLLTNPLRTVVKGVEVFPKIAAVLTMPKETKQKLTLMKPTVSITRTNLTPTPVQKVAVTTQLNTVNAFVKSIGLKGW